ncbi:hypothetical protein HZA75_07090 [Candidatus Roizmanbacteria bacterium]|nr:hypothetical protein [Candidatus Roizmanbacteria bacterium]
MLFTFMDHSQIPSDREWFSPPMIPDITTETDFYHGGHVAARVHNSLRYPDAIDIAGVEHKGAYDIRFMRQAGEPYTPEDIKVAGKYLNVLGLVMDTIVEHAQTIPVKVEAFTVPWYRNQIWRQYMELNR